MSDEEYGRALNRAWGRGYEAGCNAIDTGILALNPYAPNLAEHEAWESGVDDAYADKEDDGE